MNLIDRAINYINPDAGAKRELARMQSKAITSIVNSGYGDSGASRTKKALKGWSANSKSAISDIDANKDTLVQRSRDAFMSIPMATAAIIRQRTNVIGAGLKLRSRIDGKFLGMSDEQVEILENKIEREFELWAESTMCDATGINDFYEMQSVMFISWLLNGDGFALISRERPTAWMPHGLRVKVIDSDRINTPWQSNSYGPMIVGRTSSGNTIVSGVEIDSSGKVVAYHVCNQYLYDNYSAAVSEYKSPTWARVSVRGELTGNKNILHIIETQRAEQYRGVPYLAPVLEVLKQIGRYTEAELMAAVVQSFFTAFIKSESPSVNNPFASAIPVEQQVDVSDANSYELGAGSINVLAPGEDVVFANPTRPSNGFDAFITVMAKMVGGALEIPPELLMMSFGASYSASRASLLEAWKAFKMRRTWFGNDFCQEIYVLWLSDAVASGRIVLPGFFNDPLIMKAYSKAEWHGPAQGQLDPVKEATGAKLRVASGFSTRERESIEMNGSDFDDNIKQVARENILLAEAEKPFNEVVVEKASNGGANNA